VIRAAVLVSILLFPTGCERAVADRASGAQLAAKVNGSEISIHQLRTPASAGAGPAPADAGALEKVIDRELLVQRALVAKLDHDPLVAQSIENARRQILAQAYLERSVAASAGAGSSRDEMRAFYNENPALFAERRIYRLRELHVSAPAEMTDVLRAEAAKSRDLDEVAGWLRLRGAKYSADSLTQPAEQLPLSFLPQLARMKPGEIGVFATPLGASVIQLVHAEEAPLTEQQAAPLIEQFLAGRKRLETAAAEVRRLRELATIEYVGEFKRGH
jgi:EpsD family peptidyl-prolyl cis-trans isomerase